MSKYFISYNFLLKDGSHAMGNAETDISTGINCLKDIEAIECSILNRHKNYEAVIINNYIELESKKENENIETKTLKLNEKEIMWLSNLMCSETDGSEASHSLDKKVTKLYDEVFYEIGRSKI